MAGLKLEDSEGNVYSSLDSNSEEYFESYRFNDLYLNPKITKNIQFAFEVPKVKSYLTHLFIKSDQQNKNFTDQSLKERLKGTIFDK